MDRSGRPKRLSLAFRVGLLLALACTTLVGCSSSAACPAQPITDPAEALEALADRQKGWSSLKAEARVTQWADRGRIRGTVLMFFERPAKVRFDVMSQFGPAAVLTSDGDSFQLSDLRASTFLHGPTCPENIARLLGIAIDGENLIRFLTGDTPLIAATTQSMECRGGGYVLVLRAADNSTQEIEIAIASEDRDKPAGAQRLTLVESSVLGPDGTLEWRATYDGHEIFDGVVFPTDIRLVDYVNDADTQVRIKSVSVDPSVPAAAFRQEPRSGAQSEFAPCP
ncbi:MAG: DUF4292 domain-containing protein [Myxococcota bacterium]